MTSSRREVILAAFVVGLCLVAVGIMLCVPPSVLQAGLVYGGF
jgi:hypothetical protein